ncbi:MAG: hypothetical protein ACYDB1_00150 [Acidiferrobacteraceae bacterium]
MALKTILVDGDKGGVGKSLVARVVTDMYLHAAERAHDADLGADHFVVGVIDADLSNPDVCGTGGFTTQDGVCLAALASLDQAEGWAGLVDQLAAIEAQADPKAEVRVVVSLPAQITRRAFAGAIPAVAEILTRFGAVPVWVLNRTQESVAALAERYRLLPQEYRRGLAVRNLFFGDAEHFLAWAAHPIYQELVVGGGWQEGTLPELYALLAHKLGRTPLHTALAVGTQSGPLSYGEQLMLNIWRRTCWASLAVLETL